MTTAIRYESLALSELHESSHNPRRHFDAAALAELAESIRGVGILTPLLVRPNAKGYEIAAGHRRFRAAKAAQLESVPCVVRALTDQQFLEILTIENLQREDVHPLDEAKGYEALMAAPYKMPVTKIAVRVGRSEKYIYDRVKLLALTKKAQALFWDGSIEAGHAILLARLSPADQTRCIEADDALLRGEQTLYDETDDLTASTAQREGLVACSVRELNDWIKRHVRFDHARPDAMLYPETAKAVAAAVEQKQKIVEITDEFLASDAVRRADPSKRVFGERAWTRADGKAGSKPCEYAVLGVFAAGAHRGETFDVCTRKDKCLVHYGKEIRARENAAKQKPNANASPRDAYAKQQAQWKREEEAHERKQTQWKRALPEILKLVATAVKKVAITANGPIGTLLCDFVVEQRVTVDRYVPRGKSADDLVRHALMLGLAVQARSWQAYDQFPKLAGRLGVNLKPLLAKHPLKPIAKTKAGTA